MKKTGKAPPNALLDALLDGTDVIPGIPGTRPDLADEIEALTARLAPVLSDLPEADPPDGLFGAIEAEIDGEPNAPMHTQRADQGTWVQRTDKIWKKILAEDPATGRSMYLLRCLPGAVIKPHFHEKAEHVFVIEGEFWIGNKVYSAGDTQTSFAGTHHAEINMPGGCLVLVSA